MPSRSGSTATALSAICTAFGRSPRPASALPSRMRASRFVRILLQDGPGTISGFLEPAPEEQHVARSTLNGEVVWLQIGGADVLGIGVSVVVLGDVGFRQLEARLGKFGSCCRAFRYSTIASSYFFSAKYCSARAKYFCFADSGSREHAVSDAHTTSQASAPEKKADRPRGQSVVQRACFLRLLRASVRPDPRSRSVAGSGIADTSRDDDVAGPTHHSSNPASDPCPG